jgi:hypothetical protein
MCAGASSLSLVRGQFLGGPGEGRPHPPGSRFTTIAIASPAVATIPAGSLGSGPLPNGWPSSQPASPQPERVLSCQSQVIADLLRKLDANLQKFDTELSKFDACLR